MDIGAIRLHDPRLEIIAKIRFKDIVADVTDHLSIFNREQHFNSAVKVAGHQIGTTHQHFLIATMAEIEDTAVLQEPSQYADHTDIFAKAFNTLGANNKYSGQLNLSLPPP